MAKARIEWESPSRTGKVNRPYLLRSRGLCRSFGDRGSGLIVAGSAGVGRRPEIQCGRRFRGAAPCADRDYGGWIRRKQFGAVLARPQQVHMLLWSLALIKIWFWGGG